MIVKERRWALLVSLVPAVPIPDDLECGLESGGAASALQMEHLWLQCGAMKAATGVAALHITAAGRS